MTSVDEEMKQSCSNCPEQMFNAVLRRLLEYKFEKQSKNMTAHNPCIPKEAPFPSLPQRGERSNQLWFEIKKAKIRQCASQRCKRQQNTERKAEGAYYKGDIYVFVEAHPRRTLVFVTKMAPAKGVPSATYPSVLCYPYSVIFQQDDLVVQVVHVVDTSTEQMVPTRCSVGVEIDKGKKGGRMVKSHLLMEQSKRTLIKIVTRDGVVPNLEIKARLGQSRNLKSLHSFHFERLFC